MFKPFRIFAAAAVLLLGASAVMAQDAEDADVTFNLSTAVGGFEQGAFAFMGTEGDLEGVDNPDLVVSVGDVVTIVLTVGPDGMEHDFYLDEFDVASDEATPGNDVTVTFTASEAGEYEYYCIIPGHREGGMYGKFIVEDRACGPVSSLNSAGQEASCPAFSCLRWPLQALQWRHKPVPLQSLDECCIRAYTMGH